MSRKLGIKGTFIFTGAVFSLADTGYLVYFTKFMQWEYAVWFQVCLIPLLVYFSSWFMKVLANEKNADFRSTMKLNWISASAMNLCFIIIILFEH